jgi:hypothetical protein
MKSAIVVPRLRMRRQFSEESAFFEWRAARGVADED